MTDQPPAPPPDMPHFERPPSQAGADSPARPVAARPTPARQPANVLARRPWVVAAGMAGTVVVAAAAGYGYGRQADAPTTSATSSGSTNGVTVDPNTGSSGGSTQDPFSGGGSNQVVPPGSGSTDGSGQTQVLPGDPSDGFGAQPGTVSPDQGGPTTQSRGS